MHCAYRKFKLIELVDNIVGSLFLRVLDHEDLVGHHLALREALLESGDQEPFGSRARASDLQAPLCVAEVPAPWR